MSNRQRGDRYERSLIRELEESGWSTLRAPSSGSGTKLDRPDVIALQAWTPNRLMGVDVSWTQSQALALELKACSELPVYLDEAEIEALERWSERAGATPLVGISPDKRRSEYDTDRYIELPDLDRTDSGNYVARDSTTYRAFSDVF